ncbi:glutamine synthetase family protein [Rhodococcus ruber]|uniref:Glutamine synthetase family protein n=1 Tax=Rhodococcus ruber TaxID=1830 RepID=A0ABT4MEM3_9NOCA|nr:glutamine synthetase family protein [Rhodococcus ruber]MCZ4519433.1 glutamine synthetase family protein [Rhodococcus ruber]
MGFIEKFELWTDDQHAHARDVLSRIQSDGIRSVRLSFVDQHGLLRGKTLAADALPTAFRDGFSAVSTLLSKDTSGITVFSAFEADGGHGVTEMGGAGDLVMVPDPTTFRVIQWADRTAWILCDLRFTDGGQVPFCSRTLFKNALEHAHASGYQYMTGLEIEFHLYHRRGHTNDESADTAARPTGIAPINYGNQLLSEERGDELEPVTQIFRDQLATLGIDLRTIEVEYGPNQVEVTLDPEVGITSADSMVLLRSSIKQLARRNGYHATFMCRPQIPDTCSSGWHLHQSLLTTGADPGHNVFSPGEGTGALSELGLHFIAGQLRHAHGACAFAAPTINGYKRFQPYSMAPDRVTWARDNRGAMIRIVGAVDDRNIHIENRIGEPAANPYLYMASQLHAGLLGIESKLPLGPSADDPYSTAAQRLPSNLAQAVDALDDDTALKTAMGAQFVDYYVALKRAEIARFDRTVTDWEQREYFDLY